MTYRVWNNVTKRFLRTSTYIDTDGNLYKDNDPHGLDMSGKRSISPIPNCTIMRSTGLHDKNGKEIFEGDLIKSLNITMYGGVREIQWHDQICAWVGAQKLVKPILLYDFVNPEVIGNIYEHKHLLK